MWRQSILHHFLATRNFWSLTDVILRYIISVYFFIPSFYILSSRSLKGEFASLFALRILEEPTKPKFDVATKIARLRKFSFHLRVITCKDPFTCLYVKIKPIYMSSCFDLYYKHNLWIHAQVKGSLGSTIVFGVSVILLFQLHIQEF